MLVVDILGTRVALLVEPQFASRLRAQWARCLTTGDAQHVVDLRGHSDRDTREYTAAWQATLHGILRLITPRDDSTGPPARLNLHAAGLAGPSGSVLALVGASGSGKTTAAATLGRRLGYVTDECVSVDPVDLRVRAYPKPLSVVTDPAHPLTKGQAGPDHLGLRVPGDDLRLGRLVVLRRSKAHVPPALSAITLGEALLEILPQVSGVGWMPTPLRSLADVIHRTGAVLRLDYHEIEEAAALLEALADGRRQVASLEGPAREVVIDGADPGDSPRAASLLDGTRIRRRAWADAVETDEQVVVFDGSRPVLLEGLGRALWLLLGPGVRSLIELHDELTELLGAHSDSRRLVREAVASLSEAGLLDLSAGEDG